MVTSLKLTRSGAFHPLPQRDWSQCGQRGIRELLYRVVITARSDQLNERGFIIDNMRVAKYWDTRYQTVAELPSCERIALAACEDIARMVRAGGAEPQSVTVHVGASRQAFVTATLGA
jgi:hypothetical protein